MSVRPVTFYEVACNEPGCDRDTESLSSEYAAWAQEFAAIDEWINHDGIILPDGRAFCGDHARDKSCCQCEHQGTDIAEVDGEPLCPKCVSEAAAVRP